MRHFYAPTHFRSYCRKKKRKSQRLVIPQEVTCIDCLKNYIKLAEKDGRQIWDLNKVKKHLYQITFKNDFRKIVCTD